MYLTNY